MPAERAEVLVVGAGAGGLVAALAAAEAGARVRLVAAAPLGQGCNTAVSGGGFMMATDRFSTEEHARLTLQAGCGLGDPALVRALCEEANDARAWLESALDARFNLKHNGQGYWFAQGGAGFFRALSARVAAHPRIGLCAPVRVARLVVRNGVCRGAVALGSRQVRSLPADATVLATGGYAGLYARHDNPGDPVGAGIALALEAGATVRDLEFVQFYPLGLCEPQLPTFMAFRPFPPQARLLDPEGRSLTERALGTDDLNEAVGTHRDRLSLAMHLAQQRGAVRLDLTAAPWGELDRWFSLKFLKRFPFPWETQPARVAPIAHHTMGGVAVDAWARTTLDGLYAVGELASGLHGANRLGSNSLSECLVFGRRAGQHAARRARLAKAVWKRSLNEPLWRQPSAQQTWRQPPAQQAEIQALCWRHLGLQRQAAGIEEALAHLEALAPEHPLDAAARQVAHALGQFALRRCESRGAHVRSDAPETDSRQNRSQFAVGYGAALEFVGDPHG